MCPANWKGGAKTIKPDPLASKEYFAATANGAAANGVKRPAENGHAAANGASEKKPRHD